MIKCFFACTMDKNLLDLENEYIIWCSESYKRWALQEFGNKVNNHMSIPSWNLDKKKLDEWECELTPIYKRTLSYIYPILNRIHSVKFDYNGWNYILGCWLYWFIQDVHNKYEVAKYVIENEFEPTIWVDNTYYVSDIPNRPEYDYIGKRGIQIYSDIFEYLGKSRNIIHRGTGNVRYEIIKREQNQPSDTDFEEERKAGLLRLLKSKLGIKTDELIACPPFSGFNLSILFLLSFGRIDYYTKSRVKMDYKQFDFKKRKELKWQYDDNMKNDLESFILLNLWKNIPSFYIEQFSDFVIMFNNMKIDIPRVLFSYAGAFTDPIIAYMSANVLKNKGRINLFQHGGNYGLLKYVNYAEFDAADTYYTWGTWGKKRGLSTNNNFCVMPISKILGMSKIIKKAPVNRKSKILMTCSDSTISYHGFLSYITPKFCNQYLIHEQEDIVISQLLEIVEEKDLLIRLFPISYEIKRFEQINKMVPLDCIDKNDEYYSSLLGTSLHITCDLETTYLESIALDIPTIVICPDDLFYFSEEAMEIVEKMREQDIFINDANRAMQVVKEIYNDPRKWWGEKERKKVICDFRKQYAKTGLFSKTKWYLKIIDEVTHKRLK